MTTKETDSGGIVREYDEDGRLVSMSSSRRGCADCRKKREAAKAAAKALLEGRPFTMKERIQAARDAFKASMKNNDAS